jgi:hypothetical protein
MNGVATSQRKDTFLDELKFVSPEGLAAPSPRYA